MTILAPSEALDTAPTPYWPNRQICPCCGEGFPICTDVHPGGTRYSHYATCAIYNWADDVCLDCELAYVWWARGAASDGRTE